MKMSNKYLIINLNYDIKQYLISKVDKTKKGFVVDVININPMENLDKFFAHVENFASDCEKSDIEIFILDRMDVELILNDLDDGLIELHKEVLRSLEVLKLFIYREYQNVHIINKNHIDNGFNLVVERRHYSKLAFEILSILNLISLMKLMFDRELSEYLHYYYKYSSSNLKDLMLSKIKYLDLDTKQNELEKENSILKLSISSNDKYRIINDKFYNHNIKIKKLENEISDLISENEELKSNNSKKFVYKEINDELNKLLSKAKLSRSDVFSLNSIDSNSNFCFANNLFFSIVSYSTSIFKAFSCLLFLILK